MITRYIKSSTNGNTDIIDITPHLATIVKDENVGDGILFLSVIGSTAALSTMEYESGLLYDVQKTFETIVPCRKDYAHNLTWSDDNGHAHLRSTMMKTHLFVSVTNGKFDLGTWQQVVLIDFDTRPRERTVVVKILAA